MLHCLQKDLDEECYTGSHKQWALYFGMPSLVIFVAGVPIAAFLVLWSKRRRLHDSVVKNKYGFLYRYCSGLMPRVLSITRSHPPRLLCRVPFSADAPVATMTRCAFPFEQLSSDSS